MQLSLWQNGISTSPLGHAITQILRLDEAEIKSIGDYYKAIKILRNVRDKVSPPG